jgi:hypothetical protein
LELTEYEEILVEESVDPQLIYCLHLMCALTEYNGSHLVHYKDIIIKVIDKTINLKCVDAYEYSSILLKSTLTSLTSIYGLEFEPIKDQPLNGFVKQEILKVNTYSSNMNSYQKHIIFSTISNFLFIYLFIFT